jgi:hypothetical protein
LKSLTCLFVFLFILSCAPAEALICSSAPHIEILVINGITYKYVYNTEGQLVDIIVIDEN